MEMLYALLGSIGAAGLFLWLFVRSAIANGILRAENTELKKNVDMAKKQLDIAANHPDTPADLAKRMRDGTL